LSAGTDSAAIVMKPLTRVNPPPTANIASSVFDPAADDEAAPLRVMLNVPLLLLMVRLPDTVPSTSFPSNGTTSLSSFRTVTSNFNTPVAGSNVPVVMSPGFGGPTIVPVMFLPSILSVTVIGIRSVSLRPM
jgi:hypothetical protein